MDPVKRPYLAPRRAESAAATRRAVLAAAHELFVRQGYAATTVSQVAEAAGVSRPTVFAVGSKAQLLALARDLAMAGDDAPLTVAQRGRFQRVLAAPTAAQALGLLAEHVTDLMGRYAALDGVLHQASGTDAACRKLWETSEAQRRTGAGMVVDALNGPLGVSRDEALDSLWALMASEPYRRLVLATGWAPERYAAWLAALMRSALVVR